MKTGPSKKGFVLLEAMIAVTVFALGVVALGKCMENCLSAERVRNASARAVLALKNRMVEVEAGSVAVTDKASKPLKGMFEGLTLKTSRVPLKKKNEKDQELFGIFLVTLEVSGKVDGLELSRELSFYVYPRQR